MVVGRSCSGIFVWLLLWRQKSLDCISHLLSDCRRTKVHVHTVEFVDNVLGRLAVGDHGDGVVEEVLHVVLLAEQQRLELFFEGLCVCCLCCHGGGWINRWISGSIDQWMNGSTEQWNRRPHRHAPTIDAALLAAAATADGQAESTRTATGIHSIAVTLRTSPVPR